MNVFQRQQGSITQLPGWFQEDDCSLADFATLLADGDAQARPRFAARVEQGVPIYEAAGLAEVLADARWRRQLQAEWAQVLLSGAGVLVLRQAYPDTGPVDEATAIFEEIIRREREAGISGSDHFAKAGANDRIWNAAEKLCLTAPEVFARYYANPLLVAIAQAWLGPNYQMTAQVNVVRPGGQPQQAHRDYHLGFQTVDEVTRYPAHVHLMSPLLILQGAVAHSDMPVVSGPTKLLPFSQRYEPGYLAWRRAEFREYFEAHYVQLPLQKGDMLFFNPALFHAAGGNRTADIARMANLLQISSAYGRAMESLDRVGMCETIYPVLRKHVHEGGLSAPEIEAVIASCAEGYAFPTNLDRDPPRGGLAPPSQQDSLRQALAEDWPQSRLVEHLREQARRRLTV